MSWTIAVVAYSLGFISFFIICFLVNFFCGLGKKRARLKPILVKIKFDSFKDICGVSPLCLQVSIETAREIYEDYNNSRTLITFLIKAVGNKLQEQTKIKKIKFFDQEGKVIDFETVKQNAV